jgi:hypothetical protein
MQTGEAMSYSLGIEEQYFRSAMAIRRPDLAKLEDLSLIEVRLLAAKRHAPAPMMRLRAEEFLRQRGYLVDLPGGVA